VSVKLGIIGGIGPESTLEYYRQLVVLYRERVRDGSYPAFILNSIDLDRVVRAVTANDLAGLTDLLVKEVEVLAQAGATYGLLAANTPHIVFDAVQQRSHIPLISIVEATCAAVQARGLRQVALFGTRFTMQGRFYPDVFARAQIVLVVPEPEERTYIHDRYMQELIPGVFLPETHTGLLAIIARMKERSGIEAVILGGTELPLILKEPTASGIPLLDTTRIHVHAAIEWMLAPERPGATQ
jgi:aspartate racemase